MHIKKHAKRQEDAETALPTIAGFSGVASAATALASTSLILNTDAAGSVTSETVHYSIAANGGITLTSTVSHSPTSQASSTATSSATSAAASSHNSDISIGAVVGICVGAFAGLALLLFAFYLYSKRSIKKEQKNRAGRWDKLAEGGDRWEGSSPTSPGERELQEKNSQMFKKSSPSMRTTRTKALDDDQGGFSLPPLEFAKYHPGLAKELALEQPSRPYAAHRGESGVSWDGSTVHEDSFLEMRSVRVESGAVSPTLGFAKMTPVAEATTIHQWESAEVLTMGDEIIDSPTEVQNPFNDVSEQRRSVANPFFNAQELQRRPTRSRSNSLNYSRRSRAHSIGESTAASRAASIRKSERVSNPFADIQEVPVYRVAPPDAFSHSHMDSVASGNSVNVFGAHAMKSLIAALDLRPEEIEERLRVLSMDGSTASRMSTLSGQDDDADIATVRSFPMPPPAVHIQP